MIKKLILFSCLLIACHTMMAQQYPELTDTSRNPGKGLLALYKRFDKIKVTGYLQTQFQLASVKGQKGYIGGDFAPEVNNRFMIRRGRVKFDYINHDEKTGPGVHMVFQIDATERGVFVRDLWAKINENRWKMVSLTTGIFNRPFSYELNLSSSDRESPERGRMSQILMKTERDIGAMLSIEPLDTNHFFYHFKLDAGFFNGQGLTAPADFDSHKDFITRLALKPIHITTSWLLSSGISYLDGGMLQNTPYVFTTNSAQGIKTFLVDSSSKNKGEIAPRKYYGADIQLKNIRPRGATELRAEFIAGKQVGSKSSSESPAALFQGQEGQYIRDFNGAYFYLLHQFATHHQLGIKYDWYDPNSDVTGKDIGVAGSNLNAADIKYSTLGLGYINYMNPNVKLVLWYDRVSNEATNLPGFTGDKKDNVFTCRLQVRF